MSDGVCQTSAGNGVSGARQPVRVRTPCRLHFGMFSFGHANRPQYGGVGIMIEPPAVEVAISGCGKFNVVGVHAERVCRFVELACDRWGIERLPKCRIEIAAPPDHVGLGVGTQLGLAVATSLRRFCGLTPLSVTELSASIGRGGRSSVGTYGFEMGGLIIDAGKMPGESIGTLEQRVEVPAEWRFVLLRPADAHGLAGEGEAAAFAKLPPVPVSVTETLWRLTTEQMLPAVAAADCNAFGDAVFEFGKLAGECFASAQGGSFANPAIERRVKSMRAYGVRGVGQSSWGPTVFAIVANDGEAQRLLATLHNDDSMAELDVAVARPNNTGAVFAS